MCLNIALLKIRANVLVMSKLVFVFLSLIVNIVLFRPCTYGWPWTSFLYIVDNYQVLAELKGYFNLYFSFTFHMNLSENIGFVLVQKKKILKMFIRLENFFAHFWLYGNSLFYKLPVIINTSFIEMYFKSNFLFNTLGNYSGKWLITSVDIKYCTANHHAILHAVIH